MSWLVLIFALECGLIPTDNFVMYQVPIERVYDQAFYIQMEAEVELFDLLFIGGTVRTYVWKKQEGISFWPWRDGYLFKVGLRKGPFELGFRHYCTHPVIPYRYPIQMNWEGAYEEIYFRVEGQLKR